MKELMKISRLAKDAGQFFREGLYELAFPTRCVHCEEPGELLCDGCRETLMWIDQRYACPDCGSPYGYLTCTECQHDLLVRTTIAALVFRGQAARMVLALKDEHELRLAPVIAAAMVGALEEAAFWEARDGRVRYSADELDVICYVPATREAYLRRGFDHMKLISEELSKMLGLPVASALYRNSAKDQRELNREGRAENLRGQVEVIQDVVSMRILLVDDVLTTGASIRECARCLLERGAKSVVALVLARVF